MPILTKDTPYEVAREIVYLEDHQGRPGNLAGRRIRPRSFDPFFEDPEAPGSVACIVCELVNLEGRVHPGAETHIWLHADGGGIEEWSVDDVSADLLRKLARYIASPETPEAVEMAAGAMRDEPTQYLKAYYLRHCTIVGWDDLAVGLQDLECEDPEGLPYGPSLSELLGRAYAREPHSNHARLEAETHIKRDLSFHDHIINQETGFRFRSV